MGVVEFGHDLHLALEPIDGAFRDLGPGEHDLDGDGRSAGFGSGEINRSETAAPEFLFHPVAGNGDAELSGSFRRAEEEFEQVVSGEFGDRARREAGSDLIDGRAGEEADLQNRLADPDLVAVLQFDLGVVAFGPLLRGFLFFPAAGLFPVHFGSIEAAQVPEGSHGWTDFEQEMVARDLGVLGKVEVAVVHPPEEEGVVLGQFEDPARAAAGDDLEDDFGGHGFFIRPRADSVNRETKLVWKIRDRDFRRPAETDAPGGLNYPVERFAHPLGGACAGRIGIRPFPGWGYLPTA